MGTRAGVGRTRPHMGGERLVMYGPAEFPAHLADQALQASIIRVWFWFRYSDAGSVGLPSSPAPCSPVSGEARKASRCQSEIARTGSTRAFTRRSTSSTLNPV